MMQHARTSRQRNYAIAAGIFAVGLLVAGLLGYRFVTGLLGLTDDLQQVVVPGTTELMLEETGSYTIFYEYRSTVDGRVFRTPESVSGLNVELVSLDTGEAIPLTSPGSDSDYSIRGRAGRSVLSFRIDQPGRYALTGEYASGAQGPEVVLAIGHGFGRELFLTIVIAFAAATVFCLSTIAAIALVIVTTVRTRRETVPPGPVV